MTTSGYISISPGLKIPNKNDCYTLDKRDLCLLYEAEDVR